VLTAGEKLAQRYEAYVCIETDLHESGGVYGELPNSPEYGGL
jgi:hypothetical protein